MRKTKRKLLAVLLAFTMLFGSSMTVFARDYDWQNLQEGNELQNGDTISVTYANLQDLNFDGSNVFIEINSGYMGYASDDQYQGSAHTNYKFSYQINNVPEGKVWKVVGKGADALETTACFNVHVEARDSETVPQTPSTNPTPSSDSKEPTKIEEVHSHSLSWVETVEPSETTDGLMEYKCSCGYVEERSVISGSMSFVKNIVRQIETAPGNSTVGIKTEYYTCYTAYIMDALKKRPDVSLKTSYKDKDGSIKTFTIPAGKAPDDGELFYGFTYLGNLYGWDE